MSDNVRLFIAAPIPAELQGKISKICEEFKTTGANVKWVDNGNFHITLKFLGETPAGQIDRIIDVVISAASSHSSCTLKFGGFGAFPNMRRPRVFWVGLKKGGNCLAEIAENLDSKLKHLGFPVENRKFSGHLTLGRVRSVKRIEGLIDRINKMKPPEFEPVKLEEIHLVKSELTRKGPIYTVVKKFPLKL